MKKHWTQTARGRARMAGIMKQSWAKRKKNDVDLVPMEYTTSLVRSLNNSVVSRVHAANTVADLEEIKAFLDLRDELLARLP